MNSPDGVEHFVTLFDSNFLPMGMTLHGSLMNHATSFHLWIICMDEQVEEQLTRIALPHVTLLPLREVETRELLAVKPGRNSREYCWTVTPFSFRAVFQRDGSVQRVTYLDADLFFFADPRILLGELNESGKDVLITEHAFAPEHSCFLAASGRFCVQFLTFRRTAAAAKVMGWWQEKCLEWCFDRMEEERFGDQKYLDLWPELFPHEVHILRRTEKTLAPWNVNYVEEKSCGNIDPVFYHFQGLRITGVRRVQLHNENYAVGRDGQRLYDEYLAELGNCITTLQRFGMALPLLNGYLTTKGRLLALIRRNPCVVRLRSW